MAWCVFVLLVAGYIAASLYFIPSIHRWYYKQCRKDRMYWIGNLLPHSIWIVAAIQNLISPSIPPPLLLRVIGVALFILGGALIVAARRVNVLFIAPIIYVPPHMRVTEGPYRLCKHPGYAGGALVAMGAFFLLGQIWAFFPTLAYLYVLSHRVKVESRILSSPEPS